MASWMVSGTLSGGVRSISRTRSINSLASAVCAADATASTLCSALRVAAANGVSACRASDTAIATISAGVKFSGGRVAALSTV